MHPRGSYRSPFSRSRARRVFTLAGMAATVAALAGCETDSFIDPSITGRWEQTPTVVPVLDRLAAVEGPVNQGIERSQIKPEDLIPEIEAYRLGPGDLVEVEIQDLFGDQRPERFEREIDARGFLEVPQIPPVYVDNATAEAAQQRIAQSLRDAKILENANVTVVVRTRRRLTYNVLGGVGQPGVYQIRRPDYRLLEALSEAGRFAETVEYVYVIRQIPLSDVVTGRGRPAVQPDAAPAKPATGTPGGPPAPGKGGENLLDLIDELSKPKDGKAAPTVFSNEPAAGSAAAVQPASKPPIDLVDDRPVGTNPASGSGTGGWQFVNGQWVQTAGGTPGDAAQAGTGAGSGGQRPSDLLTQRVIEVPLAPLLAGSAAHNIVIRPGDVIRVPSASEGLVYMGGQVNRPGPYTLPAVGKLTLTRAVVSAGGLGSLAIPERVDIIRFVGPDRQAMVRVNLRAIEEGTQPDILLKADDRVNVGSNFWAFPLAVVRQGLRASYGFGFILDRNFGFDVFGPQNQGTGGF